MTCWFGVLGREPDAVAAGKNIDLVLAHSLVDLKQQYDRVRGLARQAQSCLRMWCPWNC